MPTTQIDAPHAVAVPAGRGFERYAWAVLAYNVAVALWGTFVRATGSGAGCGAHWPLCNGEIVPRSPGLERIIEFTHRSTSGVSLVLVAALVVWAFRAFPKRHPARLGATLSGIFLITEALLGAALVLLGHVANNPSASRVYSLAPHMLNTLVLLACLTLTAWWAGGKPALNFRGRATTMAAVSVAMVALMGLTGVIAALGDTLFPARSLAEGLAQDFDPGANLFVRLRWYHPWIASLGGAWLLYYAASAARGFPHLRKNAAILGCLVGAQLLAGATNLILLAPVGMQMVHLLLAYLVWIALVLLAAATLIPKVPAQPSR